MIVLQWRIPPGLREKAGRDQWGGEEGRDAIGGKEWR